MTALLPLQRPARVTLTLADGRQAVRARQSHRGDFDAPFGEEELRGKFRQLAQTVLTEEGADRVADAVDHIGDWPDLGVLTGLLRQHGRP
jgi:2-methylcitrate dehydratase PrpD